MADQNPSSTPDQQKLSVFGSFRKLVKKVPSLRRSNSNVSETLQTSVSNLSALSISDQRDRSRSPDSKSMNASPPAVRQPFQAEPPPAYTASPAASIVPSAQSSAPSSGVLSAQDYINSPMLFLQHFDTVLLIDDSSSMKGNCWKEVSQVLREIAPVVTEHDKDGIDIHFLNDKKAYTNVTSAKAVSETFKEVKPQGLTPTGKRLHDIIDPYLADLKKALAKGKTLKPINIIVITDGAPTDPRYLKRVLLSTAERLDNLDVPRHQLGVQFFQVGYNDLVAAELRDLDDNLCQPELGHRGRGVRPTVEVRDIVDTVTWTGGVSPENGGGRLTKDAILKVVLGAVVKKLDQKSSTGDDSTQSSSGVGSSR